MTAGWQIADVLQPFARGAAAILEKSAFTAEPFLCIAVRRSLGVGFARGIILLILTGARDFRDTENIFAFIVGKV